MISKKIEIVNSILEPLKTNMWFKDGDLKYWSAGGWQSLVHDKDRQELETKVDEMDKEIGEIKKDLSVFGSTQGVIELEIGDATATKVSNLKKLHSVQSNDHTFFTDINYGYGTASWLPTVGGSAFITTGDGHNVYYTIGIDGSVTRDDDYIQPNEPYQVIVEEGSLSTDSESVALSDDLFNKIKAASSIKLLLDNGKIEEYTYTSTFDFESNRYYYGVAYILGFYITTQWLVLDYATKTIKKYKSQKLVDDIGNATKTTPGLVKATTNIADVASTDTIVGAFNQLLKGLREAGILI